MHAAATAPSCQFIPLTHALRSSTLKYQLQTQTCFPRAQAIRAQRSAQEAAAAPAPKDPAVDKKKQAAQKAREWRQAQLAQGAKAAAQRQQQVRSALGVARLMLLHCATFALHCCAMLLWAA